jgi:tetratricopeptide (TPR) repeat protein
MVTDWRGSAVPAQTRPQQPIRPSFRHLWQVPCFLLGCAVFLSVWFTRPIWYDADGWVVRRNLAEARLRLQEHHGSLNDVPGLVSEALSRISRFPDRAGEAHYLLGSAYLFLARKMPEERAREAAGKARAHLEQAQVLGVPDEDRDHLTYRLAKCWFLTDGDPWRTCEYLAHSIETGADDRAEGYAMLTKAFLRLNPPHVQSALDANDLEIQLTEDEDALAAARLLRGELLLRLKKREEARKVLERIGPRSAPEVLARARSLLARTFFEDQAWKDAADRWQALVSERHLPADAGSIFYWLGMCYRNLDRPADAEAAWQRAFKYKGEPAQAAGLRLSELRLTAGSVRDAVDLLEQSLEKVQKFGDYSNSLLDAQQAQLIVQTTAHRFQEKGDFDTAQRIALLEAKLSPRKSALVLWAQIMDAWGRAGMDKAKTLKDAKRAAAEQKTAVDHFLRAGTAFQAAADESRQQPDEGQWLWQASEAYFEGRDPANAVTTLRRFVLLPGSPERLSEAWYRLGEGQKLLRNLTAAGQCFQQSIACGGRAAYLARCQLAELAVLRGKFDLAEEILQQNLELLSIDTNSEAYERTLFLLANVLFMEEKYQPASTHFELALDHFRTNPGAVLARFRLAECYRILAEKEIIGHQPGPGSNPLSRYLHSQRLTYLEKAIANYQTLANDLDARQHGPAPAALSEEESDLLRLSLFRKAECLFLIPRYDQAIGIYEALASQYQHQYDGLVACRELYNCHLASSTVFRESVEKARKALERAKSICNELDDGAFKDQPESRLDWERWIRSREQELRNLSL